MIISATDNIAKKGYTDQQWDAITLHADHICVNAGAGSGKTRVLIDRVIRLLQDGAAELDEIVAITFTDRAASEMKQRLRRALRKNVPQDRAGLDRWRRLERQAEYARISTIHTFCGSLLRENSLALGLDPDFSVLPEGETQVLLGRVVRDTVHALLEESDAHAMAVLEEMRLRQVEQTLREMLQKRSLLSRVLRDLPWESADELLRVWRRVQAEAEMEEVRRAKTSPRLRELIAGLRAYDGACARESDRREACRRALLAFLEKFSARGDNAMRAEAAELCAMTLKGAKKEVWPSEDDCERLSELIRQAKAWLTCSLPAYREDELLTPRAAALTSALLHVYAAVQRNFAEAKRTRRSMDFDDLIHGAAEALTGHEEIRNKAAAGMKFLLVDEFQDTDGLQLQIVRALADAQGGPELFIVGDAKQSIYYFRGAEVDVFGSERERATLPISMAKNFRSRPGVLNFINSFFTATNLLYAVEPKYRVMEVHREEGGGAAVEFLIPQNSESDVGGKTNVEENRRAEARLIAARIKELVARQEVVDDQGCDARYGQVAMLFRSMSNVHLYEDALRRAGVPYSIVQGAGFFERQEILDVLNVLKLLLDPWDEMALFGFLRSPMCCLSDEDITRLACAAEDDQKPAALARAFHSEVTPPNCFDATALMRARELYAQFRAQRHTPLGALLRGVLDATQYEAVVLSQWLGLQKASNLRKLVALADDFSQSRLGSVRDFLEYVRAIRAETVREGEALLQPEERGAVTIMTIHKSKGLEFDVVIVPDMGGRTQGHHEPELLLHRAFPPVLKITADDGERYTAPLGAALSLRVKAEEEAEKARLLYVALTRAREKLLLCGPAKPEKGTWFHTMCEQFRLGEVSDGGKIAGEGWHGTVIRDVKISDEVKERPLDRSLDVALLLERVQQAYVAPAPNQLSVSALVKREMSDGEGDAHEERENPGEHPRSSSPAILRGTLVHRMLELWRNLDLAPPIAEVLAEFRPALADREKLQTDLGVTAQRVRNSAIAAELGDPRTVREAPFLMTHGAHTVSGTIDAILPDGSLLDYKTGRFNVERHAQYEAQLRLYGRALANSTGSPPPRAWLFYVDEERLEEVQLD